MAHILIIDDEVAVLRALTRVCGMGKHTVLGCTTAEEAMRALTARAYFDLIITDVVLPGESGLAFLQWLERNGVSFPVVIMTAYPHADFVRFAVSHGAQGILIKPFENIASLYGSIEEWVRNKKSCMQPRAERLGY